MGHGSNAATSVSDMCQPRLSRARTSQRRSRETILHHILSKWRTPQPQDFSNPLVPTWSTAALPCSGHTREYLGKCPLFLHVLLTMLDASHLLITGASRCLVPRMTFLGLCGQIPSRIRKCHLPSTASYHLCLPRRRRLGPTLVYSYIRARCRRPTER